MSSDKFQFQYNGETGSNSDNLGFLRVKQTAGYRTATINGKARAMSSGSLIDANTFDASNIAEISGDFYNWTDLNNVFIPAMITIKTKVHFGYLNVSYDNQAGQLTIHATSYNRIPEKAIRAGDKG
ncbi:hypothetical protein [Maribacter halichondriae]|uniref:hypothetical protein n=1 Tax=Maribacter halichondriae TaxID=2980554 RepID=UPI002359BBA6|nr:hypothetical protein [Maribacter sp. Hal144]